MSDEPKIYDELLRWKQTDEGRTAVLIQGARRVGKSTVAEEFAKNEYDTHILVDFAACSSEIRDLFNDVSDLNRIFMRLQLEYGIELKVRKSALSSMKSNSRQKQDRQSSIL